MRSSLSSRERAAVAALERRQRNESVHTRHVTRLALELFDAIRTDADLTAADRRLLEAATRLHDIGYRRAPLDHVRASARIARRALPGFFTAAARQELAAIVRLHAGRDYRAALDAADFPLRPAPARVLKLGALLRVADGLDNGHVQDADLRRIRMRTGHVEVQVRAPHWPRSVKTARRKADLWEDAFTRPLVLRRVHRRRAQPLVSAHLARPEALRRLLSVAYRSVIAGIEQACEGDVDALHEVRIAIRRCRALLRALRTRVPAAALRAADRALSATATTLGAARDLDIQMSLLPARSPWRSRLKTLRLREQAVVKRVLSGPRWDAVRAALGRLLRVELPGLDDARPAGAAVRKSLRKAARRAAARLARTGADREAGHALRTALRRIVHLAEIHPALVRRRTRRDAEKLRPAVRALGAWRDHAQLAVRLAEEGAGVAALRTIQRRADEAWAEAAAALRGGAGRALRRLT